MKTITYSVPNPLKFLDNTVKMQAMKRKASSQKAQYTTLKGKHQKLQALVKGYILSLTEETTSYRGNNYQDYESAIIAIQDKYDGTANWGVLQTGNIIDLRAVFVINEGPKVVEKEPGADAEVDWANKFLEFNDIDNEVAQVFATEAEIEGKIALKLSPVKWQVKNEKGKFVEDVAITARYISWVDKRYTITTNPNDYLEYLTLAWKPTGKTEGETLEANEFVYKKFGGRISNPNSASPKIMKCLTQVDNLDRALRDWREINRIFAAPILYMKVENKNDVKQAMDLFEDKNFKIKKTLAGIGDLMYVKFDIGGVESIEKEIITIAKMVAGTTGVSVQYLGLADLLKNRSTSDDLREMLTAATTKERQIWKGAYEELIHKAMIMYNEVSQQTPLDPNKIGVEIPVITQAHWQHIEKVFLPAAMGGKISDETLYEQIPSLDVKKELERKAEKEASDLEAAKVEAERLRADLDENNLFGEED